MNNFMGVLLFAYQNFNQTVDTIVSKEAKDLDTTDWKKVADWYVDNLDTVKNTIAKNPLSHFVSCLSSPFASPLLRLCYCGMSK